MRSAAPTTRATRTSTYRAWSASTDLPRSIPQERACTICKHAGEPEPEEEEVDDRDQDGGELVLPGTDHHRREQLGRRAFQPEAVLDPVGKRGRILVGVARGDEEHRDERQEQVGAQQHREQLTVGRLVAAHPADRRALPRVGRLVLDPETAPLGHRSALRGRLLRTSRDARVTGRIGRRRLGRRVAHAGTRVRNRPCGWPIRILIVRVVARRPSRP